MPKSCSANMFERVKKAIIAFCHVVLVFSFFSHVKKVKMFQIISKFMYKKCDINFYSTLNVVS
jgi:hypothetical protein